MGEFFIYSAITFLLLVGGMAIGEKIVTDSMYETVEQCERDLPRSQSCKFVAVPESLLL